MENINEVTLSGKIKDLTVSKQDNGKVAGSFYLEWLLPSPSDDGQACDRVFCMIFDDVVSIVETAERCGDDILVHGRLRTKVIRHEGKNKKPVHSVYLAVKSAFRVLGKGVLYE